MINNEGLFSRPSPANKNQLAVDEMPDHFNWIAFVDRLSGGDITKDEIIYKMNYSECLMRMSYWHEKDKYTERMNRASERKYKR